jgi:DNA-binding LacI/PurR family transcriptional regulator
MPDLQTEIFTKVLPNLNNIKFDDPDELETPMPVATESVALTRQAFAYIHANPHCAGKEVLNHFTDAGHKRPVVASTVTYLIDTKRVAREDGRLITLRDNYERPKKVAKATDKPVPMVQNTKQQEPKPTFDIDALLGTLSMYQGRELYTRLKSIYGG